MPTCKNCQTEFTIYPEDKTFYGKIGVPKPTFCPACREQRRLSWRPTMAFYQRDCDLCHKSIVTQYSPNVPFPVYCPECWWGDSWDRYQGGRDYDPSESFFLQFIKVMNVTPRLATFRLNCINCDYADKTANSKNCYLVIGSENAEDCYYGEKFLKSKDCIDCNTLISSELCYFCFDSNELYNIWYPRSLLRLGGGSGDGKSPALVAQRPVMVWLKHEKSTQSVSYHLRIKIPFRLDREIP